MQARGTDVESHPLIRRAGPGVDPATIDSLPNGLLCSRGLTCRDTLCSVLLQSAWSSPRLLLIASRAAIVSQSGPKDNIAWH